MARFEGPRRGWDSWEGYRAPYPPARGLSECCKLPVGSGTKPRPKLIQVRFPPCRSHLLVAIFVEKRQFETLSDACQVFASNFEVRLIKHPKHISAYVYFARNTQLSSYLKQCTDVNSLIICSLHGVQQTCTRCTLTKSKQICLESNWLFLAID